jgi:cysteine sulfinate desulfinase/cysteine desulfurase-like protein
MGVSEEDAMGAVRFTFSRYNTEGEVDRVLETIPALNEQLLKLSRAVAPQA